MRDNLKGISKLINMSTVVKIWIEISRKDELLIFPKVLQKEKTEKKNTILITPTSKSKKKTMSGPIRAGVYGPREDVDKTSLDYPAVKVRYASYEQIEKRALIHQQDSGDITKDFLVRTLFDS